MRTPIGVHGILLAGNLCFAALPVAGRLALAEIPPALIVLVRTVGGALVFAAIAAWRGRLGWPRGDVAVIAACALLGNVLNQELFIHGLARTTATNAVVIGSTIPVFTLLVALVLGREQVRPHRVAGIAVAFGGVVALVGAEELSLSSDHVVGSLLVLANALAYGSYLVVGKPLAERYDPLAVLAYMFIAGTPMVAPLGIAAAVTDAPPLNATTLAFFVFLIAVPTVGAYGLVQNGLKRAESSLVAVYIYVQPVAAAIGAVIVLDESVGPRTLVCGGVVLLGVWLAARTPREAA